MRTDRHTGATQIYIIQGIYALHCRQPERDTQKAYANIQ